MDKVTDKILKPCPFCGTTKLKIDKQTRNGRVTYSVRCNCCHARGGTSGHMKNNFKIYSLRPSADGDSTEELVCMYAAIDKWNQRMEGGD